MGCEESNRLRQMNRRTRFMVLSAAVFLVSSPPLLAAQTSKSDPVDLRVDSVGETTLAGSLFLPAGDGPFPAVIITHGSEAGGRSHTGYVRWAEWIRARGVAVLVFDKRGVGDSEGTYVEAPDLSIPAADVIAWQKLLKARGDIEAERIGVLGWSQGGWTGPLAASQSDLAFVVMISGPGISPLEQNIYDKANRVVTSAPDAQAAERGRSAVRLVMTYLVKGIGEQAARAAWAAVVDEPWFADNYTGIPLMDRDDLLADPRGMTFVTHNAYEPAPVLRTLEIPVLAVFGGADRIVPYEESLEVLRRTLSGGSATLTEHVFPGANHGIGVRGDDGTRRFADGYPDIVLDWIEQVTG